MYTPHASGASLAMAPLSWLFSKSGRQGYIAAHVHWDLQASVSSLSQAVGVKRIGRDKVRMVFTAFLHREWWLQL